MIIVIMPDEHFLAPMGFPAAQFRQQWPFNNRWIDPAACSDTAPSLTEILAKANRPVRGQSVWRFRLTAFAAIGYAQLVGPSSDRSFGHATSYVYRQYPVPNNLPPSEVSEGVSRMGNQDLVGDHYGTAH